MFVNYVALMLVNMVAGLVLLATFVYTGIEDADKRKWAPGFAIVGFVALVTGLHMIWHWPLPGSHNIAFGEPSVLFGVAFLGAALAMACGWDLVSVALYGSFAGLYGIVIGIRLINLGMTRSPILSGFGFVLAGLAGLCGTPAYLLRKQRIIRILGALVLLGAAAIWAVTGYLGLWGHLADYAKWLPPTMK